MSGAWGFFVRDHEGSMILVGAENLDNVHDVLCAEAHACLIAITAAANQGMMQIQFESDSMVLVKALKSPDYDLSAGGTLFREAKFLVDTQFISFNVNYVPHFCNVCAHELACCGLLWTRINPMFGLIPFQSL
jgi:hypothetical protein